MTKLCVFVALLLALFPFGGTARATVVVDARTVGTEGDFGIFGMDCSMTSGSAASCSGHGINVPFNINATASISATQGSIGAAAAANLDVPPGADVVAGGSADAIITDNLTIAGSGNGFFDMTISEHGSFSSIGGPGATVDGEVVDELQISPNDGSSIRECAVLIANASCTVEVPVVFGSSFFFRDFFDVQVTAFLGTASIEADFIHTANLGDFQVFDANHNLITDPTIISESGFDYSQLEPVPEPDTLAIIICGILAIWYMRGGGQLAGRSVFRHIAPC